MNTASMEDKLPSLGDDYLTDLTPTSEGVVPLTEGWRSPPETIALDATDQPPLVMGDDGDDTGRLVKVKIRVDGNGDAERTLAQLAPRDMLDSGHGFLVRSADPAPKTVWATNCEVCGGPLLPPASEWFCQLGNFGRSAEPDGPFLPASTSCDCSWCIHYQLWLRGEYRPRGGRPAKRCGTAECKRKANRDRQRKSRAARKARDVTETP
ncbi:Uncharacterised protein [Mycobacteroides abscessus subsp. massiliense]|nr:Uncharacterised protein [Mycobacteroides abscessus subsp. massiliense]